MAVYVIAGDDKYMVWRDLETRRESYLRQGHEVLRKESAKEEEDGSFFGVKAPVTGPSLWIFELDPGPDILLRDNEDSITVMVCLPGVSAKKLPEWVSSLPKKRLRLHESPKPWEVQDRVATYVMAEGNALGLEISPVLAHAMVKLIGPERVVLRQELRRISVALRSSKKEMKTLTGDHVRDMSHGLGAPEQGDDVAAAMISKDPKKVSVSISRALAQDPSTGGILRIVAFLRTVVRKWLLASLWREKGVSGEEVAEKVGMHPYRYKLQVIPALLVWNTSKLEEMMDLLESVEIGCKEGGYVHVSAFLESSLILLCESS